MRAVVVIALTFIAFGGIAHARVDRITPPDCGCGGLAASHASTGSPTVSPMPSPTATIGEWRASTPAAAAVLGTPDDAASVQPTVPGPVATVVPGPSPVQSGAVVGFVTHYHRKYIGGPLGCGAGVYDPDNPTIAASAYDVATGARPYECGTALLVVGPAGAVTVTILDACPGCAWNHLDLSEAGKLTVCGSLGDNCAVTITRVY